MITEEDMRALRALNTISEYCKTRKACYQCAIRGLCEWVETEPENLCDLVIGGNEELECQYYNHGICQQGGVHSLCKPMRLRERVFFCENYRQKDIKQ